MLLAVRPQKVFRFLLCVISLLALASLGGHIIHITTGHDSIFGLRQLFNMDDEMNVPALYSASALLLCSVLLFCIYWMEHGRPVARAGYWLFLSAVFLFLACDEAFSIHEELWRAGHDWLVGLGFVYFTWIIPASVLVLLVFLSSFRFLARLDYDIRWLMIFSGAIFVTGAAFIEELCHLRRDALPITEYLDPLYLTMATAEEFMEMLGVVLFLYALLRYIETRFGAITFHGFRFWIAARPARHWLRAKAGP